MNKFIETIMNFINENTTLLIIICVFLIFVLIGYLIDNSIKTRKMEKELLQSNNDDNKDATPISQTVVEVPINETVEKTVEEEPTIEEPVIPIVPETTVEEEKEEVEEEVTDNEIKVDEKVNDILLRDFSSNGIQEIDLTKEEPKEESEPIVKEESVYKNDKKLSDIFKKKETKVESNEPQLEKTVDFNNELDRILQKLNEENNNSNDSTLDETTDFTNMF